MATEADGSNDPAFDPDGKYLFFLSEREINPTLGSFELSYTVNRTSRPQALVLRADLPSPFAPQSDEAKPVDPKDEEKKKEEAKKKEPFRIDLEGLRRRVVPFPVGGGQLHRGLRRQRQGVLAVRAPLDPDRRGRPPRPRCGVFDLEKRKEGEVARRPPGLRPLARPREGPAVRRNRLRHRRAQGGRDRRQAPRPLGPAHGARPPGGVGADLPGRVADRARLLLPARHGEDRLAGHAQALRGAPALGEPSHRPHPPAGRAGGRAGLRPLLRGRRRPAAGREDAGGGAGRRAPSRPEGGGLPDRPHLSRGRAGPRSGARRCATGGQRRRGRVPAGHRRQGPGPRRRALPAARGQGRPHGDPAREQAPEPDGRPRGRRSAPAPTRTPSGTRTGWSATAPRSTRPRRDAWATCTSPTWAARACRSSSGSTTRRSARRPSSSTCGPTAAASSRR